MTRSSKSRVTRRQLLRTAGATATLSIAGCVSQPGDEPEAPGPTTTASETASTGTPEQASETSARVSGGQTPWRQFGRNARNTGYAPETTGPRTDPAIAWQFDAQTPTMNTSPVVDDGTVYVAGSGDPGYVYAVDVRSGESTWRFEPAGYVSSSLALADDVLFFGTWGKRFYAVDAPTGEELWSTEVGHRFGSSSPVVVGGTVYVGTIGDGPLVVSGDEDEEQYEACALLALDAATGDERWRYDDFGEKDNVDSSPAVANGRVYFGGDDGVYALDTDDGSVVWERQVAVHSDSSPAIADGLVYYGGPSNGDDGPPATLWALDATTGETEWTAGIDDDSLRASPAVADGTVYVPASSMRLCLDSGGDDGDCEGETLGRLYAVDATTGDHQWRAPIKTDTRSSPAVTDDTVYVGCRNGVSAVTTDGEPAWRIDFESEDENAPYVDSSPAVSDDVVCIGASDGTLRAITSS
ncbi:Outer membrane protein assembly factor BamB, contains PQQ-like beta-propeller repeat [Halomicrobium zhouii]|uniref:Outer membrane protein assembly factor BamB, contains PQQ-like beta-propeller repeat n=1 Tax=Halomicrobium zhouii TaxID=767519 RepID=A0A1I6L2H1_9EURY|nr:PQQ-binding-like beta-propeller repeat protein [Halomicrobium zhouii]SFR97664.1 Outer membrane protein assembly factor BamB, contains PQQ-like beta-propeller repeat [Halomicrobium zhouii]